MLSFVFLVTGVAFIFGVAASVDNTTHRGTANTVKTVCKGNYAQATYQGREDRNQVDAIFRQKNIKTVWMPYHRSIHPHWMWANNTRADNRFTPQSFEKSTGCAYIYLSVDSREVGRCSSQGFGYICEGKGKACLGDGIARGDCLVKGDRWFVYGCGVNNWYEARYRCEQMGTELATITSDQFIRDFKTQWIDNQKKKCVELWYGLHRESWGLNGTSEDTDDVSPSIHLLWEKGEPGDVNNCSVLHRDQREVTSLRSADCVSEHYILCLSKKVPGTMLEPKTTPVTSVSTPPVPCTACSGLLVAVILLSLILGLIAICLASFFIMREYCGETLCFSQTFGRICGSKDKKKPKQSMDKAGGTPKTTDKKDHDNPEEGESLLKKQKDQDNQEEGQILIEKQKCEEAMKTLQKSPKQMTGQEGALVAETDGIDGDTSGKLTGASSYRKITIKLVVFTSHPIGEIYVDVIVFAMDDTDDEKEIRKQHDLPEERFISHQTQSKIQLVEEPGQWLTIKIKPSEEFKLAQEIVETESVEVDRIFDGSGKSLMRRCLIGLKESVHHPWAMSISYSVQRQGRKQDNWKHIQICIDMKEDLKSEVKEKEGSNSNKDNKPMSYVDLASSVKLRVDGADAGHQVSDHDSPCEGAMAQGARGEVTDAENPRVPAQCENNTEQKHKE